MSNETKWTPGPWECNPSAFMSDHSDTRTYFVVTGKGLAGREKANAQLIAAAPYLYEALNSLAQEMDMDGLNSGTTYGPMIYDAMQALAKARGE